jgi:hypothetical protein
MHFTNPLKTLFLCCLIALAIGCNVHAGPIYKQFGNRVLDVTQPNNLVHLHGTINSVQDGIVTLEIHKSVFHPQPAQGNAGIGAYSASGSGYYTQKYDRTVAITNFPDLENATIDKEVRITAERIGTLRVAGAPLEFYDCGTPYVPPPPTPEQIKAAQEDAQKRALEDKKRAWATQIRTVIWLQSQATNGDISAQCSLGLHYLNGQGCETNRQLAIYWLQKAADQGDLEASNKLVSLNK